MVNTVDTYWEADGVSLQTLAWNITTLGPTYAPPPLRGDDQVIPGMAGARWLPKEADSRIIPLGMWLVGTDANGNAPSPSTVAYRKFESNWRAIARLLWTPGRQFNLTKRFYADDGVTLRSATARAEFAGGMEPTMFGRRGGRFTVNLKLADPYFYDDVPQDVTLLDGAHDVTILGDAETSRIVFDIEGARAEPEIRNNTLDYIMQYNDDLLADESVRIDVQNFRSTTTDAAHPLGFRSDVKILRSGGVPWFKLQPGVNEYELTSAGTGPAIMHVWSAWL